MDENTSNEPKKVMFKYDGISKKPESLLLLLNKYIEVLLKKYKIYKGFVRAIDPISKSIILLIPHGETFTTTILPGHNIMAILEVTPDPDIKLPECQPETTPAIDIIERKTKVIAWLQQNLLPVSESGDNILLGNATLLPPYTVEDICTNNPMVVMEMRKIIERMPQDFDPQKPIS